VPPEFDQPSPAEDARFARRVAIAAGIIILFLLTLALLWYAKYVLLMVFGGIMLAILLRAMSDPLAERLRINEKLSLGMVTLALVLLIAGISWLTAPGMVREIEEFSQQVPEALQRLKDRVVHYEWTRRLLEQAPPIEDLLPQTTGMLARATGVVSATLEATVYVLVVLFVGIYVAVSPEWYIRGLLRLVPIHQRPQAREVIDELGYTLRWWLIGRLISMAAVGVMTGLGLWLIGVPLPLALGIIAGLLDFIPNLGPIIAMFPALLLAFGAEDGGTEKLLYTFILYIVVQQIESFLITPIVQQRAIHMPPALTITVQVLMGLIAGILGLTLATPIAAAGMVLIQMLYVRNVLGDPLPKPSEDTS
jgi:predicted PurR-regulated permease PerM